MSQVELLVIHDNGNDDNEDDAKQSGGPKDNYPPLAPGAVSRQSLGADSLCLVCLQSFAQMENGFQLRRLPCQRVYCRFCIEPWFVEFDFKCPDRSCFWNSKDTTRPNNSDAQPKEH